MLNNQTDYFSKYENYSYAVNTTSWILDKPSWYWHVKFF